jgi:hypothetical protein
MKGCEGGSVQKAVLSERFGIRSNENGGGCRGVREEDKMLESG